MSIDDSTLKPEELQPLDMKRERERCSFDVDGMTCIFAGNRTSRDRSRWLMSLLENHPEKVFDKTNRPFQGRTERFMTGQKIALEYFQIRNRFGLPKEDRDLLRLYLDEYITLQVHESMGHPTVQNQASEQQWKEWGPKIASGKYLVSYAQTEMAHGSALAGLRTTAKFCPESDEWVSKNWKSCITQLLTDLVQIISRKYIHLSRVRVNYGSVEVAVRLHMLSLWPN